MLTEWLKAGGTIERLDSEFDIASHRHPTLPLIGLNYRITAPKTNALVMECRGTVVEEGTWKVVAYPFPRFFNAGEALEITYTFVWDEYEITEKHDGSLIILFNYKGYWVAKTRGSFVGGVPFPPPRQPGLTFEQLFWRSVDAEKTTSLSPEKTYLFEICGPSNKVVRRYTETVVYLLAVFDTASGREIVDLKSLVNTALSIGVQCVMPNRVRGKESLYTILESLEKTEPDREGFVIQDRNGLRLKVKSKTYQALHRLTDNGDVRSVRNLIPLVLAGSRDKIVTYFPEILDRYDAVKHVVDEAWAVLLQTWRECHGIESQKNFALSVLPRTPFHGLLFGNRKRMGNEETLAAMWLEAGDLVEKVYFKTRNTEGITQ